MITGTAKSLLGTAIRTQRVGLRLSQEELAHRAGLHRTYVSDVERGARNVSLESIEKLAQALELSVAGLFAEAESGTLPPQIIEILLVEDNPQDVELTQLAFKRARISNLLHVARTGGEALDFLFATGAHQSRASHPMPGVILLDLHLPGIDGLEVLRRIKEENQTCEIPVVVLTSSNSGYDMAMCRRMGVQMYIIKPVNFQNFSSVTPHLKLEWALKIPSEKDIA